MFCPGWNVDLSTYRARKEFQHSLMSVFYLRGLSTSNDVNICEPETRVLSPEKAVRAQVADACARRADLGHLDRVVCVDGEQGRRTGTWLFSQRISTPKSELTFASAPVGIYHKMKRLQSGNPSYKYWQH